jgi:hypothetical protein
MALLSSPAVLAALYLTAAIVFATVYFAMWRTNPDSFIVHQEMNLRPLKVGRLTWPPGRRPHAVSAPQPNSTALEAIYDQLVAIQVEEGSLAEELGGLEPAIQTAKATADQLAARHNDEMSKKMAAFAARNRPDQARIDQALQKRNKLTEVMTADARSRLQKDLVACTD